MDRKGTAGCQGERLARRGLATAVCCAGCFWLLLTLDVLCGLRCGLGVQAMAVYKTHGVAQEGNVMACVSNLAVSYKELGEHDKAEEMYKKVSGARL